jgi:nitric oxide reductase NorQ protein
MKPALQAVASYLPEIPAYIPSGNECTLFEHAWRRRLPVLLKGPTGCGKTRFVAHMAARLGLPLHTVACHDDLTAADLTGRYLLKGGDTVWTDGPLTRAVREGGICYLDEVVEARKDVTVVLHPLTDDRRILPLERTGEELVAPPGFMLVVSYNPGYQSLLKALKPSTRQRFVAIEFDFLPPAGDRRRIRRKRTSAGSCAAAGSARRTSARAQGTRPGGGRLDAPHRLLRNSPRCGRFRSRRRPRRNDRAADGR